jgi:methylated-DNA-[protein]-cysteine S-methyltransferase
MGILGVGDVVHHLRLGYADAGRLREDLLAHAQHAEESDWYPELRERLQAYAGGIRTSFAQIRCAYPTVTPFQRDVLYYVKRIPYGKVLSYGDVAAAVGNPGAARAVGTVMSHNCLPIIVPCHRVVAAGGKLGGYTSPRGTELKQWLLDLERAALPHRPR